MKVAIEVKNRDEAAALKVAMADKTTRAATLVIGFLLQLESAATRERVLRFVSECLADEKSEG